MKYLFYLICLILLSSCQLALSDTTSTTVHNTLYAVKIQKENNEPDYYYYPDNFPDKKSSLLIYPELHSFSYGSQKIDRQDINLIYYTDLNDDACFTLSLITKTDDEQLTADQEIKKCDRNNQTFTYITDDEREINFDIQFQDIDFLNSYRIIQYDDKDNKIADDTKTDFIDVNIDLNSNCDNVILVETYKAQSGQLYEKRSLYSKHELLQFGTRLYALDASLHPHYFNFIFHNKDSDLT